MDCSTSKDMQHEFTYFERNLDLLQGLKVEPISSHSDHLTELAIILTAHAGDASRRRLTEETSMPACALLSFALIASLRKMAATLCRRRTSTSSLCFEKPPELCITQHLENHNFPAENENRDRIYSRRKR